MRSRKCLPHIILAAILLLVGQFLAANPAGKIIGTVADDKTGDPVIGATVMIDGTTMGTKTGANGEFLILNIPPGTYRLKATASGFAPALVEGVVVAADSTSEVNIRLQPSVIETDKVTIVTGQKMPIVISEIGVPCIPYADHEGDIAVASVAQMMSKPGGIVKDKKGELHLRGGKSGETTYLVDGVNYSAGCLAPYPPAHGGTAIVNGEAFDAMFFKNYGVNPFVDTEDDHLSTFAVDVDDASFIMTRSYLERGNLPPDEAVRVEEFVNHFDYGYDPPRQEPFTTYFDGSPSKFGQNCHLLRIGIKGLEIDPKLRKAANLVFVIDVSGSMGREDRLGLVKKALRMLVDELNENDRVGLVVYGSRAREILPPTSIAHRQKILDAIEYLCTGGATNAEAGLRLGYEMAERNFEKGKINRIILCSDGVANVGVTGPAGILKQIKRFADRGITLSSIGFGMGNFNDILLEKLGNKGNGHYAYVDDIAEARRIFVDNLTGNLQVIARDVKIQVDFDPDIVRSYRLLGYENRDVDDDKFRDDKEDGGEIGAGHETTALYEIKFKDGIDELSRSKPLGTIYIRYKDPESFEVTEINRPIRMDVFKSKFEDTSPQFRMAAAAAEFSEILRKSYWAKGSQLSAVGEVLKDVYDKIGTSDVLELMHLVASADKLQEQLAEK